MTMALNIENIIAEIKEASTWIAIEELCNCSCLPRSRCLAGAADVEAVKDSFDAELTAAGDKK